MKAYQHPVQTFNPAGYPGAEWDPTVCEWGSSWDQLQWEHMCLAKIHSFYKMRNPLCQNCLVWCWNICGEPQGCVIKTFRLRKSSVHTVHIILAGSLFLFSFPFFCVQKYFAGRSLKCFIDDTQNEALLVLYIYLHFRQPAKGSNSGFCVFSKNKPCVLILVHKHQWCCRAEQWGKENQRCQLQISACVQSCII